MPSYNELVNTPKGKYRKLLGTSVKVEKGLKEKVLTAIMYLAAWTRSGFNLCPYATKGCVSLCIANNSGRLRMGTAQHAQLQKSLLFHYYKDRFIENLKGEIAAHIRKAKKNGLKPAIRLNGTSDIRWEKLLDLSSFDCQFYDYTKAPLSVRNVPDNYFLTYSIGENMTDWGRAKEYNKAGYSAALVVAHTSNCSKKAKLVAKQLVYKGMIDGDITDIRFWDKPSIVALYAKGKKALNDTTGFVHRYELD